MKACRGDFQKDLMPIFRAGSSSFSALAHAGLVGALLTSVSFCCGASPNIVFVIADDLGLSDVGYNGAEFYETPNIDKLCASDMQFREAYPGAANKVFPSLDQLHAWQQETGAEIPATPNPDYRIANSAGLQRGTAP